MALYDGFKARRLAASEPEVGNSMWYTTLSDPDGYRVHFQSATDVAEDTTLFTMRRRATGRAPRR